MARLAASLACLCLVACASAAQPKPTDLGTAEFRVEGRGAQAKVYERNFKALTEQALTSFRAEAWADALAKFDFAVREFPQEAGVWALQWNAGLCLMRLGRPQEAVVRFRAVVERRAGTRDARDAWFQIADAHEASGQWSEVAQVLRAALEDPAVQAKIGGQLDLLDELEASARLGLALKQAGDVAKADEAFKRVDRLYADHRDTPVVQESEWVVRSLYERGEIYRELFAGIRFKLPVDRMKRDLEDKANLFLKSENAYFHAVRLHHPKWSLAAGFEIGHLYQRLIEDVDAAEVPAGIDPYTTEVYREELWKHTEHLAKQAVNIYKRNIDLGKRLGHESSEWVARSEEGLRHMEALIDQNNERRRKLDTGEIKPTPPPVAPPS